MLQLKFFKKDAVRANLYLHKGTSPNDALPEFITLASMSKKINNFPFLPEIFKYGFNIGLKVYGNASLTMAGGQHHSR